MHIARIALQRRTYMYIYFFSLYRYILSLPFSLPFSLFFCFYYFTLRTAVYSCICGRGMLNYLDPIVRTCWTPQ